MLGTIFNIQRFCVNDGPGIRTTVFMKGCPLKCMWCHNPESQSKQREIIFYKDKCTGCGRCAEVNEAFLQSGKDFLCFNDAKEICGQNVDSEYVTEQVLKDRVFYENSGGGVTISGGEPLYQPEFLTEVLKKIKSHNLHTAIETCGFAKREVLEETAKYTDLFLWDFKETIGDKHKLFTGADNTVILENLALLNKLKKDVILRCPIIKGCNDRQDHFMGIAALANKYENILHIEVEPYHSLGDVKYDGLGMAHTKFDTVDENEKNNYVCEIQKHTSKKVSLA